MSNFGGNSALAEDASLAVDYSKKAHDLYIENEDKKAPYGPGPGPKYLNHLYHGTDRQSARKIMKNGLAPAPHVSPENDHPTQPTSGRTYMTTNRDDADSWARGHSNHPAIIKIDRNHPSVRGLKQGFKGTGEFYTHSHIPKEALTHED